MAQFRIFNNSFYSFENNPAVPFLILLGHLFMFEWLYMCTAVRQVAALFIYILRNVQSQRRDVEFKGRKFGIRGISGTILGINT